jgi:predicted nuclease with TOPRIM domain
MVEKLPFEDQDEKTEEDTSKQKNKSPIRIGGVSNPEKISIKDELYSLNETLKQTEEELNKTSEYSKEIHLRQGLSPEDDELIDKIDNKIVVLTDAIDKLVDKIKELKNRYNDLT